MGKTEDKRHKFLKWFWRTFIGLVLFAVLIFVFIAKGWIGYMPPIDELQNPKSRYASEVYSSDMKILSRYFYGDDNRVGVYYKDISPNVIHALVATEDERFYQHSGIDFKALSRALVLRGVLQRKSAGGGSTITQQLAKQLYSPEAAGLIERVLQKPIEWVIAVKLEKLYSKEEILAMYLNQLDFNYNAVGIKTAAYVYFGVTPAELTIEQAATLVGMCKNPTYFNPRRRNELTQGRRNVVMHQMVKAGTLTVEQYDSLKILPLELKFQRIDHTAGIARYFREYLRLTLMAKEPKAGDYAEWQQQKYKDDVWRWENDPLYGFCYKNKKSDGSNYNIYADGLKIYTTIDTRMQKYAEEAVTEHMKKTQEDFFKQKKKAKNAPYTNSLKPEEVQKNLNRSMKQSERYIQMKRDKFSDSEIETVFNTPIEMTVFSYDGVVDTLMSPMDSIRYHKYFLRCGMMSMDAHTGHVKAYVGGIDFDRFKYDMVTTGRRQVGSTIKPYLYTLGMEEGLSPCDELENKEKTFILDNGRSWTPKNGSKARYGEYVTIRWGLANSNNWITARIMELFTPEAFVNILHSFGIKGDIDPVMALALGVCDVSVEEMVQAYTSFPNKGIRVEPLYVSRIEDANGNIIATFYPRKHEVFSEKTSCQMTSMLQGVIQRGTGQRVNRYVSGVPMGGKTGTTQNHSDGWFMGFTPTLVGGVWVGGEDRDIHFDGISEGQGAAMALPVWGMYLKKVLDDKDVEYSYSDRFEVLNECNPSEGCAEGTY